MLTRRYFLGGAAAGALLAGTGCGPAGEPKSGRETAAPEPDAAPTSGKDPYVKLDATAQAELVAKGEASPLDLVDAAIARLERFEPKLNVLISERFEAARAAARANLPDGPFKGVPYLLKDIIAYPGMPYTVGSRMLANFVPDDAPPYVQATEKSGLVILGKSNTPEYGLLPTTEPVFSGPTHNPWNLERSPGGSSGGSAAAVAAGLVPFAHATDGGGSIRIPASCCGLFGLKPSRDRQITDNRPPQPISLSAGHCVSRSVRDSARLLSLTERTGADAVHAPVGYVRGPNKKRLKIAVQYANYAGLEPDPEVKAAIESTAALCAELGHEVTEAAPPVEGDEFGRQFLVVWSSFAFGAARDYERQTGKKPDDTVLEPWTLALADRFEKGGPDALGKAVAYLEGVGRDVAKFFETYDVTLSPVLAKPPVKIGEQAPTLDFDTLYERVSAYVGYTPLQNAAGTPAMSVPLGRSRDGMPIGSHFSAASGAEATLLGLAYELEQARPWADRWPPNSAVS